MVKLLTMDIRIILANVAAVAVIFLIFVYLWLDKKRFHLERQFRAAEHLFDDWMDHARAIPSCELSVKDYTASRNITAKYWAVSAASRAAWGQETPEMKAIAEELLVFLGVYHSLAEEYNRRLNSRVTGPIARFLGFKKFPDIQLETDYV